MSVADVLRASRPRVVEVQISTGPVWVRSLSGANRHALATGKLSPADIEVASLALCNEDGSPAFPKVEIAKAELEQMEGDDVTKIAKAIFKASNIKVKDDEEGPNP